MKHSVIQCQSKLICQFLPMCCIVGDCSELDRNNRDNGTYDIYPYDDQGAILFVYCVFDMDGTWTVSKIVFLTYMCVRSRARACMQVCVCATDILKAFIPLPSSV